MKKKTECKSVLAYAEQLLHVNPIVMETALEPSTVVRMWLYTPQRVYYEIHWVVNVEVSFLHFYRNFPVIHQLSSAKLSLIYTYWIKDSFLEMHKNTDKLWIYYPSAFVRYSQNISWIKSKVSFGKIVQREHFMEYFSE